MNNTPISNTKIISFNCKSIKRSVQCIRDLCRTSDIVLLQETWLLPHDLDFIHSVDNDFDCAAISSVDVSTGVLRGRPHGGLAIMWRKARFSDVTVINCAMDRIMAIQIKINLRSFLVFNVYMPTDELDNLPDFTNCLARINAITEESDVSAVYALGDFNAHPTASFGKELKNFCDEQEWVWADVAKLDISSDTFTFISEAHGSRRWLDHCITTQAALETVLSINVLYDVTWSDHFPLRIICNFNEIAEGHVIDDIHGSKTGIRWGVRDNIQIDKYYNYCKNNIVNINDSFICHKCESYENCNNLSEHFIFIDKLYSQIVKIMQLGSKHSLGRCNRNLYRQNKQVTGWNLHVQNSHAIYRLSFGTWILAGKPSTGIIYDEMVTTRKDFKNKLRWCQRNVETIKLDILAMYRKEKNFPKFWKETKKFSYKQSLPLKVNGLYKHAQIANMFADKFKVHPRSINTDLAAKTCHPSVLPNMVQFTPDQVTTIVQQMKRGKSPGHDELSLEHVLHGSELLHIKLCKLYNLCVRYSYLPQDLMKTLVIPIIKNKTGDVSSVNNYRPISLGTIAGKILERLMQPELLKNLVIDDAQFGFRPGLSTDSAILSLKYAVDYYTNRETSVYACFLDLSQAFDLVNYDILWEKLCRSNVSSEVVNLLRYWYGNQVNSVKWGDSTSNSYKLECGVRQGGITSPDLFNVYVNDLIEELRSTKIGCHIGNTCVNSLSYADDMVVLSPSIKGLRKLLSVCEHYANAHGLKYNATKSEMLVFRSGKGPERVPEVILDGSAVRVVSKFKYLGHVLTEYLKDDCDIERERRALSIRCNMLARRFGKCSKSVKIVLFNAYCQCFYTCQLWTNFLRKSYTAIRVQYNDAFRILMGLPRYCSASGMFAESRVPDFYAVMRKRVSSFWERLRTSQNQILKMVCDGMPSKIFTYWLSVHGTRNRK